MTSCCHTKNGWKKNARTCSFTLWTFLCMNLCAASVSIFEKAQRHKAWGAWVAKRAFKSTNETWGIVFAVATPLNGYAICHMVDVDARVAPSSCSGSLLINWFFFVYFASKSFNFECSCVVENRLCAATSRIEIIIAISHFPTSYLYRIAIAIRFYHCTNCLQINNNFPQSSNVKLKHQTGRERKKER